MTNNDRGLTIILVVLGIVVGLAAFAVLAWSLGWVTAALVGLFTAVATALLGSALLTRVEDEP